MRSKSDSFSLGQSSLNSQKSKSKQDQPSFFDDPDKILKQPRQLWSRKKSVDQKDVVMEGAVFKINKNKSILKEMQLRLCGNKLIKVVQIFRFRTQNAGSKPLQFLEITNMSVERINNQKVQIFGIRLQRSLAQLDIFMNGTQVRDQWYAALKQHCIQKHFHSEYTTNKLIGQGNFAKVYGCTHKVTNIRRAVKAFEKEKFQNIQQERAALIRELDVMRQLDHKGVLHLHEVFENDSHVFFVCDYLEGGELFQHLKCVTGGYDENLSSQIIKNLLQSLAYVHAKGIIHRDIKPENIILRTKNDISDVCIADFGLADVYRTDGNYQFKRCGTPGYVAPEILKDQIYDYKVDIFSVGVLMFIILTGKAPFQATSYKSLVMENFKCNIIYSSVTQLSQDAQQLLRALLSENPLKRPTALEALKFKWFTSSLKRVPLMRLQEAIYPAFIHQQNGGMYVRTPLMNQNLNQSISPFNSSLNASNSLSDHLDQQSPNNETLQMWNQFQQFQQFQQLQQIQQMQMQQLHMHILHQQMKSNIVEEEYIIEEELPTGYQINSTTNNLNHKPK